MDSARFDRLTIAIGQRGPRGRHARRRSPGGCAACQEREPGARIAYPELIREMIAEDLAPVKAAQLAAGGTIDA